MKGVDASLVANSIPTSVSLLYIFDIGKKI